MSQPTTPLAPPRIFVSHSHEDTAFCREFVACLRAHHLDVWYDEHNLGWGMLHQEISRQLDTRDCFIVILSPAAVASRWVNREIGAALDLEAEGRINTFVIVVAASCDIPALLRGYRRIQASVGGSLSAAEAAERAFRAVMTEHANIQSATPIAPAEPPAPTDAPSTVDTQSANVASVSAGVAHVIASIPPHSVSLHQKPPIPSAPISLPPDIFPARLASLGFTAHRGSDLTTILVPLPTEDMKGRLIGREGRNLRAFEEATGVTLTIDDTPLAVILSSSTPTLRQIACLALTKLIASGRIHPASIEDAVAKARLEAEIARLENLEGEYILPPLCNVPSGPFQMGSDPKRDLNAQPDEPLHTVEVPAFQIARYPVTVTEYACFVRAGHREPQPIRAESGGVVDWHTQHSRLDHPITGITWYDATAYATWLARISGQYWRLPTEAEWEKAGRWDSQTQRSRIYPWGDTFDASRSNTDESNIGTTTPIGQYGAAGASPYRAEDMAGNVWEWTATSHKSQERVLRGGSWYDDLYEARTASRDTNIPSYFDEDVGFRLVLATPAS